MLNAIEKYCVPALGVAVCLFTLAAVNFNLLQPMSSLAVFIGLGLVICYLVYPVHPQWKTVVAARWVDVGLAALAALCCLYVVWQTEPLFRGQWLLGQSLGDRAGIETPLDFTVGFIGLVLVLEATRRSIGWIVPALSLLFVAHSYYCYLANWYEAPMLPDALLPHAGQSIPDLVGTTFLQSTGVFGTAADVMFKYVFLFVVFGSFLEMSGATQFIIGFATRVFGRWAAGPALVSVLGSGMMGSLSGSAVANAVTTGSFTIPMMRNAGFPGHIAGGITAAAASGGALVPPVMGAGAYMMLELVDPQPSFLQIIQAAIIPACLYYFSILAIVWFYSGLIGASRPAGEAKVEAPPVRTYDGVVFFGALGLLVFLLTWGFSPFKAVSATLVLILFLSIFQPTADRPQSARWLALLVLLGAALLHQGLLADELKRLVLPDTTLAAMYPHGVPTAPSTRTIVESLMNSLIFGMLALLLFGIAHGAWRPAVLKALGTSAKQGVSLVAASACVGIIIGVVQQTGVANDFSAMIKGVVEQNLFLALLGIMVCSLVLGMGVPSVVCYLLMATLMGSLLKEMGVIPLAAHFFIFYFGMMSMVTPPVALAGYAAATVAHAPIMQTSLASFRFSLVGFSLPFMFVYQPALLLMGDAEHPLTVINVVLAVIVAMFGIVALAAGLAGYMFTRLLPLTRGLMFGAAAMLLTPDVTVAERNIGPYVNLAAIALLAVAAAINWRRARAASSEPPSGA